MSEEFINDGVIVTPAWTLEGHLPHKSVYEFNVQLVSQVVTFNFSGRAKVQFQVAYDIWYNASVIASARCGQRNVTSFTMILHYGKYDH